MKSFFNKFTAGGPSPPKGKLDDKQFAAQLDKATSTVMQLSQLHQANFPLLNEVGTLGRVKQEATVLASFTIHF